MKIHHYNISKFSCLLFFVVTHAYAQYNLKGKIRNKKEEALSFVTITIKIGENIIRTQLSDELGTFDFNNINAQTYQLSFSIIGYKKKDTLFVMPNHDVVYDLVLNDENVELNEVTVLAKKRIIERQSDKIIFNVENSITSIGSNGLEAIGKAPGVRLMRNVITLVGKSSVGVMINGRLLALSGEELSNFLKSISSDDITKIEVITNPSAEFDAQGGGLINVVTKSSLKTGLYSQLSSRFQQSTYTTIGTNNKINYKHKKFDLLSSLDIERGSILETKNPNTYYNNQEWRELSNSRDYSRKQSIRLESNYFFSPSTTLGGSIYYINSTPSSIANDKIFIQSSNLDSTLNTNSTIFNMSTNKLGEVHFQQTIDTTGKKINIDLNWFGKKTDYNNDFITSHDIHTQNLFNTVTSGGINNREDVHLFSAKINALLPFKNFQISVGGKLSFYDGNNSSSYYYQSSITNQGQFLYKENVQSTYFNLKKDAANWIFQFGLRNEYTKTLAFSEATGQSYTRSYNNFFPTTSIQYQSNKNNTIALNYSRRIKRPYYSFLNPIKIYSNPYIYRSGNPQLLPSYENSIELSHTYKNNFITTFGFDVSKNNFQLINLFNEQTKIQQDTYLNFLDVYRYRLGLNWIANMISRLESNNQWIMIYNTSESKISQKQSLTGWDISFNSDNQITLNKSKTLVGSILFSYQFPWVYDAYKISSYSTVDVGIKAVMLKKKLQISAIGEDIFKTMQMTYIEQTNSILQKTLFYSDNRRVKLSVRYNLGRDKNKKNYKEFINNEEVDRIMNK